jgi:hypothetical protein
LDGAGLLLTLAVRQEVSLSDELVGIGRRHDVKCSATGCGSSEAAGQMVE